jgi:hypothetical protein
MLKDAPDWLWGAAIQKRQNIIILGEIKKYQKPEGVKSYL